MLLAIHLKNIPNSLDYKVYQNLLDGIFSECSTALTNAGIKCPEPYSAKVKLN